MAGVDVKKEQGWLAYTMAMLVFSLFHLLVLYAMQRLQNLLPLDPQGFDPVAPDLAFNTSMSFVTNTNWQNYSGETTLTHFVQMLGLTVHNFLSPGRRASPWRSRWRAPSSARSRRPSAISGSI